MLLHYCVRHKLTHELLNRHKTIHIDIHFKMYDLYAVTQQRQIERNV